MVSLRRKRMVLVDFLHRLNIQHGRATLLLLVASVLYLLALLTNSWFVVAPHSHYGIWSVTFCDFLICQVIPVPGNDAPGWYLAVQILSVLSYISLVGTVFSVLSPLLLGHQIYKKPSTISVGCLLSATFTAATVSVFYLSLLSDSAPKYHPHVSWSAVAVVVACCLEIAAALVVVKSD